MYEFDVKMVNLVGKIHSFVIYFNFMTQGAKNRFSLEDFKIHIYTIDFYFI